MIGSRVLLPCCVLLAVAATVAQSYTIEMHRMGRSPQLNTATALLVPFPRVGKRASDQHLGYIVPHSVEYESPQEMDKRALYFARVGKRFMYAARVGK